MVIVNAADLDADKKEGIFRISGVAGQMKELKVAYDKGAPAWHCINLAKADITY